MTTSETLGVRLGIVAANENGRVIVWDDGAVGLLGYHREQSLGRDVEFIIPEEYRAQHHAGFKLAMAGGERSADAAPFHLPVVRADQTIAVFAVRFIFLDDPKGRPAGAMIVFERASEAVEPFTPVSPAESAG